MRYRTTPVRFTGQHFTIDTILIADAIKIIGLKSHDIVLDIGAGKGFITTHLCQCSKQVIAIEQDKSLSRILRKKFASNEGVQIVCADFRKYDIPKKQFKVVANIPYGITADILRSLLFVNVEYCLGASLIMQLEPARKLAEKKAIDPYKICYHTFFDFKLMYSISPDSFVPPPTVQSALLKIERKKSQNLGIEMKEKYLDFLFFMLSKPDLPVQTALKRIFRKGQIRELAPSLNIHNKCTIAEFSPDEWSYCFKEMLKNVPERYHP